MCNYTKPNEVEQEVQKCSHSYEWITTKVATCTTKGEKVYKCIKCREISQTKEIEKLEHSYTIKDGGYFYNSEQHFEKYKCSCGDTINSNYQNHEFSTDGRCKVGCGYSKKIEKCSENNFLSRHDKTAKTEYKGNSTGHLKITTCTICNIKVKEEQENHKFNIKVETKYDNEYHWEVMECICEKTEETNKSKHTYNVNNECMCGFINKEEIKNDKIEFDDISDDAWYKDAVEDAVENGLFNGTGDNKFSPDSPITRGMFVTVLARLENTKTDNFTNIFDDVKEDSYYQESISWAVANGIVKGVGEGKFAPDTQITREAMAVIIYNYINYSNKNLLPKQITVEKFDDDNEISDWAKEQVYALKQIGLLNGKNVNNYKSKDVVTRAEGAVILQRLSEKIKSNTSIKEEVNASSTYSPNDFGQDKPIMTKDSYTEEDFIRMEAELKARVEAAGYGTRAGVVEAALYLASLDYAVPYRGTPMQRDIYIGTYNKLGMNRTWGKYVQTTKKMTVNGKEYKKGYNAINGMDCGAFVTWAMINGGVLKEGDSVGPGTNSFTNDSGSLSSGMRVALGGSNLRAHALKSVANEVEPGDIILTYGYRNGSRGWTHIGLIVGVDDENVYVAEENTTTYNPKTNGSIKVNKLVVTRVPKTYEKDVLGWVVLCDDKIYTAKNADGTENKGNMTIVWGN